MISDVRWCSGKFLWAVALRIWQKRDCVFGRRGIISVELGDDISNSNMRNDEETETPHSQSLATGDGCEGVTGPNFLAVWKLSLVLCTLAIIAAGYNIFKAMENGANSSLADLAVLTVVTVLMVFPYIAFGALVLTLRSNRFLSVVLLAILVFVCLAGSVAFSIDTNAYLNRDKSVPGGQRMWTFLIGLAQWASVIFVSAVLLPSFFLFEKFG